MYIIVCVCYCLGQGTQKNDSIAVISDSILNSFNITSFYKSCIIREKEYSNDKLIKDAYFNNKRDTLYKYYYWNDGKIAGKEIFVIKDPKDRCIKYLDEGIWYYFLICKQEFNNKAILVDNQLYELKFSKKEGKEISCIVEQFMYENNGKLSFHYKYSYDENLNSTKIILK